MCGFASASQLCGTDVNPEKEEIDGWGLGGIMGRGPGGGWTEGPKDDALYYA